MSFSSEVKAELAKNTSSARHCRIAELSGMISMIGHVWYQGEIPFEICITTERSIIVRTAATLIRQLFGITPECMVKRVGNNSRIYTMVILGKGQVKRVLDTLKIKKETGDSASGKIYMRTGQKLHIDRIVVQQNCCKRAFVKGAFMTSGSISDPSKGYHLEIVCDNIKMAELVAELMRCLDIDGKIVSRKKYSVVYIKDGTTIVDMLNIMGAHISLMNMENIRILKDISNNVNRRVNCEAANLNKTVSTAVRQIEDINYIIQKKGIQYLPENLRRVAEIRLEGIDISLKEIGEMMNPPIGKSGVNHRLRKISEIADDLREKSDK